MGIISNGTTILDDGSLSLGTGKVLQVQNFFDQVDSSFSTTPFI